jgi:galactokinase/mevalonate kinase-like predicted kinase
MYGGSVISCSIRERAHCTLDDSYEQRLITIEIDGNRQEIKSARDLSMGGDSLDPARAVLSTFEVLSGGAKPFSLTAECSPSLRDALGRRAALLTAMVGCVLPHVKLRLNNYEIAELVRKIECDLIGAPCGFLDHYMAAFGGLCHIDFREKSCNAPLEADSPFAALEPLHAYADSPPILVATLPLRPNCHEGRKKLHQRWLMGEVGLLAGYQRLGQLARLAKKALLAREWETLGALMNQDQALQRGIEGQDSESDALIRAALKSGALGARHMGPDGSIVALTLQPEDCSAALLEAGASAILYPIPSKGLTVEAVG